MSEELGFNLCVVPFLNICVPNFKLEGVCQSWSKLVRGVPQRSELSEVGQRLLESS